MDSAGFLFVQTAAIWNHCDAPIIPIGFGYLGWIFFGGRQRPRLCTAPKSDDVNVARQFQKSGLDQKKRTALTISQMSKATAAIQMSKPTSVSQIALYNSKGIFWLVIRLPTREPASDAGTS
jgi:hypothetical protein